MPLLSRLILTAVLAFVYLLGLAIALLAPAFVGEVLPQPQDAKKHRMAVYRFVVTHTVIPVVILTALAVFFAYAIWCSC
jgi:hypothetical protein